MVKSLPSISGAVDSGLDLEGDSLTLFVGGSGVGEGVVTLTSGFSGAGGASGTGFDSFDIDAVGAGVTAAGVGGSLTGLVPGLLSSFDIEVVGFPATCAGVGGVSFVVSAHSYPFMLSNESTPITQPPIPLW